MAMAATDRRFEIDVEGQKHKIPQGHRALNLFLRNVRALVPTKTERHIGTAREKRRDLERRLQVLQKEQQELIVQVVKLSDRNNQ